MGNPNRGEITFEAGGASYTFCLDFYARAMLQRNVGSWRGFLQRMSTQTLEADDILRLLHAGLFRRHRLTEEQVADLCDAIGGEAVGNIVNEGLEASMARSSADPPKTNGSAAANPTGAEAQ